jgi:hypothetical protein
MHRQQKCVFAVKALLLLSLFACVFPSIVIKTAMSNEASVSRWTSYAWPAEWDTEWPNEETVTNDTVYYVYLLFDSLNYELTEFKDVSDVSSSEVYSTADSMDDYTYATVFQYMHGSNYNDYGWMAFLPYPEYSYDVPVEHYQGFAAYLYDYIYDHELYGYTGNGHHYFVFMWTCASAKQIGYYDSNHDVGGGWYYWGTGAVGWAYAWTHQDDSVLNDDGYGDADNTDYCFIGFETFSPPLSNVTGYNSKLLGDFVTAFYDKALQTSNRKTIHQALDYAAQQAYGEAYFSTTILYNGWTAWVPGYGNWDTSMRVFGNGDNYVSIG